MNKSLILVDVSSMFFRAFYAIPNLTNKDGFPTNALYGFLSMTSKLMQKYESQNIIYCYDRPEPSFRKELDDRYKANRSEMPEDLGKQIPFIKDFTDYLGIPRLDILGFEADDLIGSYAHWGQKNGYKVLIISGDKDFAQLIADDVVMVDTMKDITVDVAMVKKKWGVEPSQFIDYLALIGDSSDNIPGVKGIGPKTAEKLIADYKTLDGIYENIESIKGSTKTKLIEKKDEAYLSKILVTIKTDIELPTSPDQITLKPKNYEKLNELFLKFDFKKFAKELGEPDGIKNYADGITNKPKATQHSFNWVMQANIQDLDGLEPNSEIYFIPLSSGAILHSGKSAFIFEELSDDHKDILLKKKFIWSGFDLKEIWRNLGFKVIDNINFKDDLMLAAYSLKAGSIDFSSIHIDYLNPIIPDDSQPKELLNSHLSLLEKIKTEMQESILKVYETIEKPCMPVLAQMETLGVKIDIEILKEQSLTLATDIKELELKIHDLAGEAFNINSPKQLGQILFEKLQIPTAKKNKTGYSTATDVLEKLGKQFPICDFVLNYRELAKLKSTYVDSLPKLVDPENGRIHTTFKQALTATGRLSSVNPNLQNIPIRTERGLQIRKAFIPTPGWDLISADYSQIELRILAHIAGDSALIKAYKADHDIHAVTASEIFDVNLKDVTKDQRRTAKAVNFGIAYGHGAYGLAEALNISRTESKEIIERYFKKFSGVKTYMEDIVRFAREKGYVETLLGRRRYLPELQSKNRMEQAFGERAAINAPMQGTQADIVKLAMIKAHKEIKAPMILQVHDELIFECESSMTQELIPQIKELMENIVKFDVPLIVQCQSGKNWLEAH
jgi:DNA polymerase I